MAEKRQAGRPATGRKGKKTSLYLRPWFIRSLILVAQLTNKSRRIVLEEALMEYAAKRNIEIEDEVQSFKS